MDNVHGRATVRDLMDLQKETLQEISLIKQEIGIIKTKVAIISAGIALAVSVLSQVITNLIISAITNVSSLY